MLTGPDRKAIAQLMKDPKFDAFLKMVDELKHLYSEGIDIIRDNEFLTIIEVGRRAGRIEALNGLLNECQAIVDHD